MGPSFGRKWGDFGSFLWAAMLAYLVIREGSKWTDVFKLIPGRTVTIGRAATNEIVIKDERCSRNHAEIFMSQGQWTLRDLDSRNGTLVNGEPARGDFVLQPGQVVRVAHCQMAFVNDVAEAFKDHDSVTAFPAVGGDQLSVSDSSILDGLEPTTITHRRGRTRFLQPESSDFATPKVGRAAKALCRLAFDMARDEDPQSVAATALAGVLAGTVVDSGAVLIAPSEVTGVPREADLQVVATSSENGKYHRISSFLASTVLREGEAVLARNIEDDSMLGSRDSQGIIRTTSVICAPIRQDRRVAGIIHIYSTDSGRVPDPDDLEFALAVADNLALALKNLNVRSELADDLTQTRNELRQLRTQLEAESEIISASPMMQRVQQQILRAAPSRVTVLIRGESGVGKELVARAIHYSSPRREGPFVVLNCAALTESLLESELFGHEEGAFTGATGRKMGKFESANSGTLMLDEIGEMSPTIQAKFLRVLEGHPFERLGGSEPIRADVRTIAATNRDLEKAVADGTFRRDLYFRLHVLEVMVPSLRQRPEDISVIATHFLDRFRKETGRRMNGFSADAMLKLQQYHWPGNVRELKNVIERAVLLAPGPFVEASDLDFSHLASATGIETPKSYGPGDTDNSMSFDPMPFEPSSLADMEKRHIAETLAFTKWNKSRAAGFLGIERSTLDRKIRRYGIKPQTP